MKKFALFSGLLLSSTALASAADLFSGPAFEPPVTYEQPSGFNWSGIFAGIHGGYGGDRMEFPYVLDFVGVPGERYIGGQADVTSSGFFAGGQVGANWQFAPQWVVGVVGDASWSDIKGELGLDGAYVNTVDLGGFTVPLLDAEAGSKVNWFGTIRGRIGFLPTERFMIYGTGGAAVGETESYLSASFFGGGPGQIASASHTNWGWSAGGGFEFAVTDNVTFNTEYLYVDLGSQTLATTGGGTSVGVDTHIHTVKAGVNLLFN